VHCIRRGLLGRSRAEAEPKQGRTEKKGSVMSFLSAPARLGRQRSTGLRDTGPVTAGTQHREFAPRPPVPLAAAADLDRVRSAVSAALTGFLDVQRRTLAAMDPSLSPVVDEVCALAEAGKRLRPLFAYWGWRGVTPDAPGPAED